MDDRTDAKAAEPQERADLRDTTVGDRDVDLAVIAKFAAALLVAAVVVHVLMWYLSKHFKASLERADPATPPVMAANPPEAAPGPRLQSDPNSDMAALRAEENAALESYAWLSPEKSAARIPVARAMEIVLANGLPKGMGAAPVPTPAAEPVR